MSEDLSPAATRLRDEYDVVVLGSGLAGSCAAIEARQRGASVLVVDKAPEGGANGNSKFSGGGFRAPIEGYSADEMRDEYLAVSQGRASEALLGVMAEEAGESMRWLADVGVEFDEDMYAARPDFQRGDNMRYHATGNGYGMMRSLAATLPTLDIDVVHEHAARSLVVDDDTGRVAGITTMTPRGARQVRATSGVVVATGGFQANTEMRVRYLGKWADALVVRGSRYNTGDGLRMCLDVGALPAGQWGDYHSAVIDARSADVECGETNINTYCYTVMVNERGERFLDEGADYTTKTYVKYGKAVLEQPGGRVVCVWDAKLAERDLVFGLTRELGAIEAYDLEGLAVATGVDSAAFVRTIEEFNASVKDGPFDPEVLDGKCTVGLPLPKSNWAVPVDTPPYYALKVTGGITFTFGGLRVNRNAQVLSTVYRPIPGLFAAGEILGEFFYYNYPGGGSLTRALVFGRIAGRGAAGELRT